jgi:hypothetical protein
MTFWEIQERITANARLVILAMGIVQKDDTTIVDQIVTVFQLCNSITAINKHTRKQVAVLMYVIKIPSRRHKDNFNPVRIESFFIMIVPV